jgi:hypothetical protein
MNADVEVAAFAAKIEIELLLRRDLEPRRA